MNISDLKVGDRVDLREMQDGVVVRIGRGTVWADFTSPHGMCRMNAPAADFRRSIRRDFVKVGEFTIARHAATRILIRSEIGGEIMEIEEAVLESRLRKLWNEKF